MPVAQILSLRRSHMTPRQRNSDEHFHNRLQHNTRLDATWQNPTTILCSCQSSIEVERLVELASI